MSPPPAVDGIQAATDQVDSTQPDPNVEQARALVNQGAFDVALDLLGEILREDDANGEVRMLRAVVYLQAGEHRDLGGALEDIRSARAAKPEAPELLGAEANVLDQMGLTRPTIDLLQALLAQVQDQPEKRAQWFWAQGVLGRCLLREDQLEPALRHLLLAEGAGDHNPDVALSIAQVHAARGEEEDCEHWVLEALRRDPTSSFARREYQLLLLRAGRKEEAAREGEIQELLRRMVQATSAEFAQDLVARADTWGRLAVLMPTVLQCRLEQIRLLARAEEHARIREIGEPLLDAGHRHIDVIVHVAVAQAHAGAFKAAYETARMMESLDPPAPAGMLAGLRGQIRAIKDSR